MQQILLNQKQPPEVLYDKGIKFFFAKITGKHLFRSLVFNKKGLAMQLYQSRDSNIGFSREFCEMFKNVFFLKHL